MGNIVYEPSIKVVGNHMLHVFAKGDPDSGLVGTAIITITGLANKYVGAGVAFAIKLAGSMQVYTGLAGNSVIENHAAKKVEGSLDVGDVGTFKVVDFSALTIDGFAVYADVNDAINGSIHAASQLMVMDNSRLASGSASITKRIPMISSAQTTRPTYSK